MTAPLARAQLCRALLLLAAVAVPAPAAVADVAVPKAPRKSAAHGADRKAAVESPRAAVTRGSPTWIAAHDAIEAWCSDASSVTARGYDIDRQLHFPTDDDWKTHIPVPRWSLEQTRDRACNRLRAGFASPCCIFFVPDDHSARVEVFVLDGELWATEWHAKLGLQGERVAVVSVDYHLGGVD